MAEKHVFSFYTDKKFPPVEQLVNGMSYVISDSTLWHRLINVLHLQTGDEFLIFDFCTLANFSLHAIHKKGIIEGIILDAQSIKPLKPSLHLYQGLLRREALHDVAYYAAQMGVTSFTPLLTSKSQRAWGGQKEIERLGNVMIAGCEQAKQFVIPRINEPITFEHLPKAIFKAFSIYCEPEGKPFLDALNAITRTDLQAINVAIGPEGGFSDEEQKLLQNAGFVCHALTPTILRSQDAVLVCVGGLRSVAGFY